MANIVPLSSTF